MPRRSPAGGGGRRPADCGNEVPKPSAQDYPHPHTAGSRRARRPPAGAHQVHGWAAAVGPHGRQAVHRQAQLVVRRQRLVCLCRLLLGGRGRGVAGLRCRRRRRSLPPPPLPRRLLLRDCCGVRRSPPGRVCSAMSDAGGRRRSAQGYRRHVGCPGRAADARGAISEAHECQELQKHVGLMRQAPHRAWCSRRCSRCCRMAPGARLMCACLLKHLIVQTCTRALTSRCLLTLLWDSAAGCRCPSGQQIPSTGATGARARLRWRMPLPLLRRLAVCTSSALTPPPAA